MKKIDQGILGVTIIWAAIITASAIILRVTNYFSQMLPILGGGAASCIIVLGGVKASTKN